MLSPIRIAGKCLAVGPANAVGDDGRRTEDPFAKRKNLVLWPTCGIKDHVSDIYIYIHVNQMYLYICVV